MPADSGSIGATHDGAFGRQGIGSGCLLSATPAFETARRRPMPLLDFLRTGSRMGRAALHETKEDFTSQPTGWLARPCAKDEGSSLTYVFGWLAGC